MLWRVELGAGKWSDRAVGDKVSSSNQDLPVGEQRRCVRCANVIHVPGASGRPGVCRPVVETGVARKTVLVPPSCNQSLSGAEQRQRVADSGRGHIKCTGPRPGTSGGVVELACRAGELGASEDQHVAVREQRRREVGTVDVHAARQRPVAMIVELGARTT